MRWATCGDPVPAYVEVRVRYAQHGLVAFRASSFDVHHRSANVWASVRRVVRVCFEEGRSEAERAAMLERAYSRGPSGARSKGSRASRGTEATRLSRVARLTIGSVAPAQAGRIGREVSPPDENGSVQP